MTSNIQQLREMIPLYLNGSLSEQQASDFRQQITQHPELEQELEEFSAIEDTFEHINMPDQQQFDSMFNQIEANINEQVEVKNEVKHRTQTQPEQHWLDKFKGMFTNPFLAWGVALAQFAVVAVIVLQTPTQDSDVRYQSLSTDTQLKPASINVVFTESATLAQLNALMLEQQLEIISGPGRGKAYQLSIKQGARLDEAVQQLRQSDIVRFAEKTAAE